MVKIKNQSKELDQYYTGPALAGYFLAKVQEMLPYDDYDTILEPSAGTGSFYNLLDTRRVGLDLDPWVPRSYQMVGCSLCDVHVPCCLGVGLN